MTILLAVLGIICVVGAVMLFLGHRRWRAGAEKGTARVTAVRLSESTSTDEDDGTTARQTVYFPTVRFEVEGRTVEFESKIGSSSVRHVGDEIGIYYQCGNPDDARLEGLAGKVIAAVVLGVVGIVLTVLAFVVH